MYTKFLSTPSARRATSSRCALLSQPAISIHALREESDQGRAAAAASTMQFLSTPSARRATAQTPKQGRVKHDFYPRPPRGERRAAGGCLISLREFLSTPSARRATILCEISARLRSISIHALREESDLTALVQGLAKGQISIHALREESDPQSWQTASLLPNFYPRPPRGERPRDYHRTADTSLFLSTPSARRATIGRPLHGFFNAISIHALREESDLRLLAEQTRQQRFLSTPSARRATSDKEKIGQHA